MRMWGLVFIVLSVVILFKAGKFAVFWMSPAQSSPPKFVLYEVHPHTGPGQIARDLEAQGIVSNAKLFYWYSRLAGKSGKFKAGQYRFSTAMHPDEVMTIIMSGISYGFPLTIPEGYNMKEISQLVEKFREGSGERFLQLCTDKKFIATLGLGFTPPTLEGYLFPDTYLLAKDSPEEEILRQMVKKYRSVFTPELALRAKELGLTEHQAVTLASIVEKETGAKEERPLISSVFHNRLKKHMRLATDPTVIYGIKNYAGKIHKKDLDTYTPYNTYLIPALPPGPISSPGKEALMATLYPAESKYLYFVSHNDGTSEFTMTFEEHKKAVAKFQLDPKAREGKSWRDLTKRPSPTAK